MTLSYETIPRLTRKKRAHCDHKGDESLPVDSVEVPVASVWVIEGWDVDVLPLDDPEV